MVHYSRSELKATSMAKYPFIVLIQCKPYLYTLPVIKWCIVCLCSVWNPQECSAIVMYCIVKLRLSSIFAIYSMWVLATELTSFGKQNCSFLWSHLSIFNQGSPPPTLWQGKKAQRSLHLLFLLRLFQVC